MLRRRQRWDRSWLRLCFCRFEHIQINSALLVDIQTQTCFTLKKAEMGRLSFCRSNLLDFVYLVENRDGTDLGYASVDVDLIIIICMLIQHCWQLFKPVLLRKRQRWDRSWLRLCFCRSYHNSQANSTLLVFIQTCFTLKKAEMGPFMATPLYI